MRAELNQSPVEVISVGSCEAKLRMPAFNTTSDKSESIKMFKIGGSQHSYIKFNYMPSLSAAITSATPASAKSGDSITFAGTFLGSSDGDYVVTIGDAECTVTSSSTSSIICQLQEHPAGNHKAVIHNKGFGNSNAVSFEYTLDVDTMTQITSGYGGGKEITVTGHGFAKGTTSIEVCGNVCQLVGNVTYDSMKCISPVNNGYV